MLKEPRNSPLKARPHLQAQSRPTNTLFDPSFILSRCALNFNNFTCPHRTSSPRPSKTRRRRTPSFGHAALALPKTCDSTTGCPPEDAPRTVPGRPGAIFDRIAVDAWMFFCVMLHTVLSHGIMRTVGCRQSARIPRPCTDSVRMAITQCCLKACV